ncbi:MAG: DUF2007 domain-containing protein [Candidatus Thiodiazotropha endolucinida]
MMQKVYESSTAPEAHMIKILLESNGIHSRVDGEHLQSGVGTLQAIGIVRLMVEDSDFIAASEIIDQWESEQSKKSSVNNSPRSKPIALKAFLAGVLVASGFLYWIYNTPVTVDGIDYNADGILDDKWEFKNNRIRKSTHDRNLDGEVDTIFSYGMSGIIHSGEIDHNFDGTFETKQKYRKGNLESEQSDINQNGIIEFRTLFKYGFIDKIEFIDEDTGKVRKRQFYKMGRLESAEFDSNGDGDLDSKFIYDIYEEKI